MQRVHDTLEQASHYVGTLAYIEPFGDEDTGDVDKHDYLSACYASYYALKKASLYTGEEGGR